MATKIYVSQIDTANSSGGQASLGSLILIGSQGAYWSNDAVMAILGKPLSELTGYTGSVGYRGSAGYQGSQGITGFAGSVGPDGSFGVAGYQGSLGDTGYSGSIGDLGYQGSTGYIGSAGDTGYRGSIGDTGYRGSSGTQGVVGYQGSTGTTGFRGSTGATGTLAFINLTDVPQSYSGKANYFLRVNAAATGIVFDSSVYITNSISTGVNFSGNTIFAPTFQNYSETINAKGNSSSTITINPTDGNLATVTLNSTRVAITLGTTGLISGRSFSITLALKQDATGGRTVDWSNMTIYWPSGEGIYATEGPTLSTQPNYTDFVTFMTFNGGVSWYGLMSAKGFPTT